MERNQTWLKEAYIADNHEPLKFVGSLNIDQDKNPIQIAQKIRKVINLDKKWYEKTNSNQPTFTILRKILNKHRITIMQNGVALNNPHLPLDLNEFRAFTLIDEYAPLIFINNKDSNNGKTFSLLYELVHIFFGRNSLYNDDLTFRKQYINPLEVICNSVAGELIAPTDLFINYWKNKYQHIKQEDEKYQRTLK